MKDSLLRSLAEENVVAIRFLKSHYLSSKAIKPLLTC